LVDPMAPLDLAVPFGTARADVAVPDAPSLDRKDGRSAAGLDIARRKFGVNPWHAMPARDIR